MNDGSFWALIDRLDWDREGDDDAVVAALAELPGDEIIDFERLLTQRLREIDGRAWARESGSSIWWGEPDGLSVDAFLYARCVVVANGREYYEDVRANPTHMPKDMEFEAIMYSR